MLHSQNAKIEAGAMATSIPYLRQRWRFVSLIVNTALF